MKQFATYKLQYIVNLINLYSKFKDSVIDSGFGSLPKKENSGYGYLFVMFQCINRK